MAEEIAEGFEKIAKKPKEKEEKKDRKE